MMGESAGTPLPANSGEPFLDAAWTEAVDATELLRAALAALGLADDFPRLRGDVNVYGRPMVTVGRIAPAAARRLAAILALTLPGLPTVSALPGTPFGAAPSAVCEQRALPLGADVAELNEVRSDPERLPA
jgi:hypothetical protein